jgi:hypothetical protein
MLISAEIERQLRELTINTGLSQRQQLLQSAQAWHVVAQTFGLPQHVLSTVGLFRSARNSIVHGFSPSDDEVLRAIDSGIILLRTLTAIPHETYIVRNVAIPIYSDDKCMKRNVDATGVMIEKTSPGGASKSLQVFPTTRTHFGIGNRVAWEWNLKHQFAAAWYRDPVSNDIQVAWDSSAEFIGRNLDEHKLS